MGPWNWFQCSAELCRTLQGRIRPGCSLIFRGLASGNSLTVEVPTENQTLFWYSSLRRWKDGMGVKLCKHMDIPSHNHIYHHRIICKKYTLLYLTLGKSMGWFPRSPTTAQQISLVGNMDENNPLTRLTDHMPVKRLSASLISLISMVLWQFIYRTTRKSCPVSYCQANLLLWY